MPKVFAYNCINTLAGMLLNFRTGGERRNDADDKAVRNSTWGGRWDPLDSGPEYVVVILSEMDVVLPA